MGLMINKNFNDKWIQKFINLLQGFFYAQYCPFGQEDERKIEQEICNLLKEYLELLNMGRSEDERKLVEFKNTLPVLKQLVISDMIAAYEGDPAAKSYMEIIIAYPGPLAVLVQRTAHSNYCSYCSSWVQRAIIYNGEQVEKRIDNCREFEKALDRSEVFRSVL